MAPKKTHIKISDEVVINKILFIRDKRVMIDSDLEELYGVTTKRLNEQVKRNIKRFPEDFMFRLRRDEKRSLIKHIPHLNRLKYSGKLPYVFTEYGAVMLASVLNSERAIAVNVQIVRIFIKMRELLLSNKGIFLKLRKLEKKTVKHDSDLKAIYKHLRDLLNNISAEPMRRIGFKRREELTMSGSGRKLDKATER